MNKISLKNLNLKEVEQLSREQLKNVLGGWSGGTGTTAGQTFPNGGCKCGEDCYIDAAGGADCETVCAGWDENCNPIED